MSELNHENKSAQEPEPVYMMEASNGMTVSVPASKLEQWQYYQDHPEENPMLEHEDEIVKGILDEIYGPDSSGSPGSSGSPDSSGSPGSAGAPNCSGSPGAQPVPKPSRSSFVHSSWFLFLAIVLGSVSFVLLAFLLFSLFSEDPVVSGLAFLLCIGGLVLSIPILLIVHSFRRRRGGAGYPSYILGSGLLSVALARLILDALLGFPSVDEEPPGYYLLFFALFSALVYAACQLYGYFRFYPYHRQARLIQSFIRQHESISHPSCVSMVVNRAEFRSFRCLESSGLEDPWASYWCAFLCAMELMATSKAHSSVTGMLIGPGEQLHEICEASVDLFQRQGILTQEEADRWREEIAGMEHYDTLGPYVI